jgi:hypothetical protein
MNIALSLSRHYTPIATLGELRIHPANDHGTTLFACKTIERPWLDNQPHVSCIPSGTYTIRKRRSPVVERTSGGEFREGWEVTDVPGRSYIMFHPGNWSTNVEGCIAVGRSFDPSFRQAMVTSSRDAFRDFMAALSEEDECLLLISQSTLGASA